MSPHETDCSDHTSNIVPKYWYNIVYRYYEDSLKYPPTYSVLGPRLAIPIDVKKHLVQSPFLFVHLAFTIIGVCRIFYNNIGKLQTALN